jgi:hypothetical protein
MRIAHLPGQKIKAKNSGCHTLFHPYHNDDNLDINGKIILLPMEPNRGVGGMISSQNNNHQDLQCKPLNIKNPDVITQEAVWETAAAAAIQQQTTKTERPICQEVARKEKLKGNGWSEPAEPSSMYLVLPSYAETQKQTIKKNCRQKAKLCSNSLFKQAFPNIDFKLLLPTAKILKN